MTTPLDLHPIITIGVFVLTLVLIFTRPRGMNEAWATVIGGVLMLVFGMESLEQAMQTIAQGKDVLTFLFALCLLSGLLDKAGFFEWAALHSARVAKGNGRALYRNVFLLGGLITAVLSLDTTAIILTPIVLSFVRRLELKAHPFLVACAFVANTGSLLLPVSNLTNLLFQSAFHYDFAGFTARMMLPQVVALLLNYWIFLFLFRNDLPADFDINSLPEPNSVVKDVPYFRASLFVCVCVLIGYFVGALNKIPPFVIALAGCLALGMVGIIRKQLEWKILKEDIAWSLFPFVAGLFVVIRAVENLGLPKLAANALASLSQNSLVHIIATAFGAGIGSNIINNIPMALLSISVLRESSTVLADQYGALLGCNLGPNLTVAGSLATMLVISSARKNGEDLSAWQFFKIGLITTPLLLLGTSVTLWLALKVFP